MGRTARSAHRAGGSVLLPAVVALVGVRMAAGQSVMRFDSAEQLAAWSFSNGPEFPGAKGELVWNGSKGRSTPGAAELRFDFSGGGAYVEAAVDLPSKPAVRRVRLWLDKPGTNRVTFRATDSAGQTFQKSVDYDCPGWQQIEVDLHRAWIGHWGGANDGVIRPPMVRFGVLIERRGNVVKGSALLDDVELLTAEREPANLVKTTRCLVADLASDVPCWAEGGPGNRREGTRWHYAFADGRDQVALVRDVSLPGKPLRLVITLEGDGSGHELRVQVASHFQVFERTLGTLDRKGSHTFEAALEPMKDWRHFGGQNDGIVRPPLRFRKLVLVRRGKSSRGTIVVRKIEVDTRFPADRGVVIIPRGRLVENKAVFELTVRSLHEVPLDGELRWQVRDLQAIASQGRRAMRLPPAAVAVRTTVEVPIGRRAFLEGRFVWRGSGRRSDEVTTTVAQPPPYQGSTSLDASSPIGVGLYLYRWYGNPVGPERMRALARLARRAGVKWTREEFQWGRIEPEPGKFDWTFYDNLVETARREGIRVYGLLAYWSGWTKPYTPQGIEDYCRWAAKVVRRYKDRIKHWEVWNEPNIFFWSGPKELYAALLKQAYKTIKREDPEAQVLGCSTSGIDTAFIKRMMELGAPFDVLTIHPYRGDLDVPRFIRELREVHELVDRRPVWITEMGWPSCIGGISERRQAGLVARTYLGAIGSGAVQNVSWYDFRNDGDDPFYTEMNFGLVRSDLSPKLGYRALATIGRWLQGAQPDRQLRLDDDVLGLAFTGPQYVIALWSKHRERLLGLAVRGGDEPVRLLDAAGQEIATTRAGGTICCTLEPGLPVYLIGQNRLEVSLARPPMEWVAPQQAVRPGERCIVELRARQAVRVVAWDMPPGWPRPEAQAHRRFVIRVPRDALPKPHRLMAQVRVGERTLRVPLTVRVRARVLRV